MKDIKPKVICAVTYLSDGKFWLKNEFERLGYDVKLLSTKYDNKKAAITYRNMIKSNLTSVYLGVKVYREYENEDIVLFWTYFAGIIFSILDLLKRKTKDSTRIVALHMLVINANVLKKTFIRFFSYISNLNNRLIISVNSEKEKISFSSAYFIDLEKMIVLPDCVKTMDFHEYKKGDGRVFCGGDNSRDWSTFFDAARILPNVKFVGIIRKRNFDFSQVIPINCELHFDTDEVFFYKTLYSSTIVALPLNSDLASGLIVLGQCAAYCKPVIITKTSCSINYVNDMETGILLKKMGDPNELAYAIDTLIKDEVMQYKLSTSFSDYMRVNHSHSHYVAEIISRLK